MTNMLFVALPGIISLFFSKLIAHSPFYNSLMKSKYILGMNPTLTPGTALLRHVSYSTIDVCFSDRRQSLSSSLELYCSILRYNSLPMCWAVYQNHWASQQNKTFCADQFFSVAVQGSSVFLN